jgi:putative PEP-CTERM system TPR-repeat lipoprotein
VFKTYGVIAFSLLMLVGCSQKTAEEKLVEIHQLLDSNQPESAIINIKNMLLKNPEDFHARFLLGKTYIEQGNLASAEKELKLAYDGGYPEQLVLPLYLKTLNLQRKDHEIISFIDGVKAQPPEIETTLLVYKALALFRTNDPESAKDAVAKASEISDESAYSLLGQAHLALNEQQTDEAVELASKLISQFPDFLEGYVLHGQLAVIKGNYDDAIKSFSDYNTRAPKDNQGKFLLADVLVKAGEYEAAESLVDKLLKLAPNQSYLNQLKGIIRFDNKDYIETKRVMEIAIGNRTIAPTARLLAGISAYKLNNIEQAHNHLSTIHKNLDPADPVKRLFADIQIRLGYNTEAVETLKGLTNLSSDDVSLFTMASYELRQLGLSIPSSEMLSIATSLESDDPLELTQIGILKLSLNDVSGITDLENALAEKTDISQARWELALAYLNHGDDDKALSIAKLWIAEAPDKIEGYNLASQIYISTNQPDKAAIMSAKAIGIEPENSFSLNFMADQAINNKDYPAAIHAMAKLAKIHTQHIATLFKYFVLAKRFGDPTDAMSYIKKAYTVNSGDLLYQLNYARALVMSKQPQEVITVLEGVTEDRVLPTFYWKAKADSYLALNETKKAGKVYSRWQKLQPDNKHAWLGAMVINDIEKDFYEALKTVKRAAKYFPEDPQFTLMEAHYYLLTKDAVRAQHLLDVMPVSLQKSEFSKEIQGRIHYTRGEFEQAIHLLMPAYKNNPNSKLALIIAKAYNYLSQEGPSFDILELHLKQFPNDTKTRLVLAQAYSENHLDKAVAHNQVLVNILPKNIIVLNNLAWLLGRQQKFFQAQQYAEQALVLMPDNANILDTYGMILLNQGKQKEAESILRRAVELSPDSENIKQHYIEATKG